MEILVNGKSHLTLATNLVELLLELGISPETPGIAIAVNQEIVRKSQFQEKKIQANDEVEIVQARQGG
ncbi:MAG: sulfur carrier protein ThiS [Bacteroidia bacterium]|nr:sulfur carrier protein ThiS [Bacteroidia bacterium]